MTWRKLWDFPGQVHVDFALPWQSLQLCGTGRQLHSFLAGLMSKSAGDLQGLQEDSSPHPSVLRPDLTSLLWLVQGKGLSLSCPGVFHELSSSSSKDTGRKWWEKTGAVNWDLEMP